jgi:hypothetical protein
MLGFSSGGILDCREHEPNPRITQITADELLGGIPRGDERWLPVEAVPQAASAE